MPLNRFQGRTLGLIGSGNMAEALARGLIEAGVFAPDCITAADPALERRRLMQQLGCRAAADNARAATADLIVIAVKPQSAQQALAPLSGRDGPEALWISIMAGVRTRLVEALLGGRPRVVRVMPNTPMLVGAGAAGAAAGRYASEEDLADAAALFRVRGVVETMSEPDLDAVTALSGSGPAYFMYLVEAMVEAAVAEGLSRGAARRLATATCRGAGALMLESAEEPAALRACVTSKGGTTQAALSVLEQADMRETIVRAVRAAARRSRELGRE